MMMMMMMMMMMKTRTTSTTPPPASRANNLAATPARIRQETHRPNPREEGKNQRGDQEDQERHARTTGIITTHQAPLYMQRPPRTLTSGAAPR